MAIRVSCRKHLENVRPPNRPRVSSRFRTLGPPAAEWIEAPFKFTLDFIQAPGTEVVRVGADIKAVSVRFVIEAAMDMAEKVPRSVP